MHTEPRAARLFLLASRSPRPGDRCRYHACESSTHGTRSLKPDQDTIDGGAKYCITIDSENRNRTGKIWNEQSKVVWQYEPDSSRSRPTLSNPFCKPDIIFTDASGNSVVVIRRVSFLPSRFQILVDDQHAGQIVLKGLFLNKYGIELANLSTIVFRMPLFTMRFHGKSNAGNKVWAFVGPGKKQWNVLAEPQLNDVRLLAALAFVHNQWFNYN